MRTIVYILTAGLILTIALLPVRTSYDVQECFVFASLIPLIVALAAQGGQIGAQAASNQKAGIERRRYEDELKGRINDLNSWFEPEYNRDFLTTDVAQSAIGGLISNQDRQVQALNNAAASGGATQEANIAAKGKLNENFADAIGRLLGYGTNYKQGLRQQYDYRLQSLYQPIDQLSQQKISDYGNFSNNVAQAGNSVSLAAGMIDWEELLNKNNYAASTDWGMGEGYSNG